MLLYFAMIPEPRQYKMKFESRTRKRHAEGQTRPRSDQLYATAPADSRYRNCTGRAFILQPLEKKYRCTAVEKAQITLWRQRSHHRSRRLAQRFPPAWRPSPWKLCYRSSPPCILWSSVGYRLCADQSSLAGPLLYDLCTTCTSSSELSRTRSRARLVSANTYKARAR